MTDIAFSSLSQSIVVIRNEDGLFSCSGEYKGIPIEVAFPIRDGTRCIVLLDYDLSRSSVFENLMCIDREDNLVWKACLPAGPDCFVSARPDPRGVRVITWSGFSLILDRNTGAELARVFVK